MKTPTLQNASLPWWTLCTGLPFYYLPPAYDQSSVQIPADSRVEEKTEGDILETWGQDLINGITHLK
jgi:hypothetical protein